jgi:hypothetical protein
VRIDTTSKRMIFAVTISDKRVIKTMNRLIHRSAWKKHSRKFVVAISELRYVAAAEHLSKVVNHGCHAAERRHKQSEET